MDDPEWTARAVRTALRGDVGELPPAPAAAVKLLRLTNDESSDIAAISRVIETEPALTAKVLQVVNSAFYGFPRRIRSISRAVTLLGFSAVRQAALHALFFEGMVGRGGQGGFDRIYFWQHCLLVAILSRSIGERVGHPDPDALYAAGLLHDLGKVILESHGRVRYSDFLAAATNSGNPIRDDEQTFFGVSHDQVGAVVCGDWDLPELICRVQSLHHCAIADSGLDAERAREVAIVSLADFIAWTQGIGSVDLVGCPLLAPEVPALIALDQLDLAELLAQADREVSEIGGFYGVRFPSVMQLRANMINTAIGLCRHDAPPLPYGGRSSHTAPHHSLEPDEFIPTTLEALRAEFGIEQLLMMQIESRRRSLVTTHALPRALLMRETAPIELSIPALTGDLVRALRARQPVLVPDTPENLRLLDRLGLQQAAAVPVLSNGRILGVLWLGGGEQPFTLRLLEEVGVVAGELGIAIERSQTFARERTRAQIDALTRLHNRSVIDEYLDSTFAQSAESGRGFALGLLDIDRFKAFNDRFGHQTGDDVLRIVADTMRGLTRPSDFLARYGGEEFLFLLHDTGGSGALNYAERIRHQIERRGQLLGERFPGHALTASIGVALYDPSQPDPKTLIATADRALYRAKETGRNRVVAAWMG
ncbi:HDOD domain-containing protein [Marichromatium sp. AB32]|uniref:sensor domain-containing diguanylate cyclase n=1 Tax=Marichromatium sp. AB32 TaxID=2483363 RepID=UPI000F40F286|nr:HDOD domain-containing protein [Marichromatium sp. AB32]RNE94237.1 HDOD domain-containing protein [Marichromatium sp. AB32]